MKKAKSLLLNVRNPKDTEKIFKIYRQEMQWTLLMMFVGAVVSFLFKIEFIKTIFSFGMFGFAIYGFRNKQLALGSTAIPWFIVKGGTAKIYAIVCLILGITTLLFEN